MKKTFMKLLKNTIFMVLSLVFAFTFSNIVRADETTTANDYEKAPAIAHNQTVNSGFSSGEYSESWYKIYVPTECRINLEIKHELPVDCFLYNADLSERIDYDRDWGGTINDPATNSLDVHIPSKGYYYFNICTISWKQHDRIGNFSIKYSIKLCPENFKVDYYGTNKLKLVWDPLYVQYYEEDPYEYASGYEIQQKVKNKWKTIKRTTKKAYTVKKLAAGTDVSFRIRAYISADNTKYYGEWNTLDTFTIPAKGKITSAKVGKSSVKVNWKKTKADGYIIAISHDKYVLTADPSRIISIIANDPFCGEIHYINNKKTTKTFKKYQGEKIKSCGSKRLYIRICSYSYKNMPQYGKIEVSGEWSSVKTIKVK